MHGDQRVYSLPRWRVTRWLADPGPSVPHDIRVAMVGNLFGSLPVFFGGVINTVVVAAAIAARMPTWPFITWLVLEVAVCLARLTVLVIARRRALTQRGTPTDIYLLLAVAWSFSVGYGVVASMASSDWVAATLACTSAAAMVGGICFRNFSAPRLAGTMIVISLGPTIPGAILGGEPLLYVALAQVPLYLFAVAKTAFSLNRMLVATMLAERENDHRARHDALTGLANRAGLIDAVETKLRGETGAAMALLFLDLDGFKGVNDSHGHATGDRMLKLVAERLRALLPAHDVPARIGGDEFVVLARGLDAGQAIGLGERLIAAIGTSYDLGDGVSAAIGLSIGIAMAPEHGEDVPDLLAAADAALYAAKSSGKSRCCMASAAANVARLRRMREQGVERPKAIEAAA